MKNRELLAAMSVQSGTASNLAHDLICQVLKQGEILKPDQFEQVRVIRERLEVGLCAARELENIINGTKQNDSFWQAEQFQLPA